MATTPWVRMTGISKRFGGVRALDAVDLEVRRAEVVALVGENGAGKSTLMKILAGIHTPDSGTIEIDGDPVRLASPRDASRHRIAIIHQELELIDTLDIAANMFLGREPTWGGPARLIDRARVVRETRSWLDRVGCGRDALTRVDRLPTAERQLVEIARALSLEARVLIMDEPTSSLTLTETERLFERVRHLRNEGVGVIYITHRLDEIEALADRVVVLRDGRNAGMLESGPIDRDRIVLMMVGRELAAAPPPANTASSRAMLEIRGVRTHRYPDSPITLTIRAGEILGLAGLVGAGRSELARVIFGVDPPEDGDIRVGGERLEPGSCRAAIRRGVYLVPEDRRNQGLVMGMSVRENVTLPSLGRYSRGGWIARESERVEAERIRSHVGIRTASIEAAVDTLSGGNQQKVALARWLSFDPRVIVFDEPTRGVDVGAKAEIYGIIQRLAASGVAVLMISSDMEEILGQSDRIAVMHEGRLTGCLERSEASQEAVMRLAVA